jgi:hypothetical protein
MSEQISEGTAMPAAQTAPKKRDKKLVLVGIGFALALLLLVALNMN